MTLDDVIAAIESPEGKAAIQAAIAQDRVDEIAFRRQLVDDCNRALALRGDRPDMAMLTQQRQFVELELPTAELHAAAQHYASIAGRTLPAPPPSLTVEDV